MTDAFGLNRGYLGLIIFIAILAGFSLWWIVSIPKNKIYTDSTSSYRFSNITILAGNPPALSKFYTQVFGCKPVKDNTPFRINTVSKGGLLSLPGYEGHGPMLEILPSASPSPNQGPLQVNDLGYAHLCFEADDVRGIVRKIVENGGSIISRFPGIEKQVCVYTKDPEGNVIEVHLPVPSSKTPQAILRLLGSLVRIKLGLAPSENAQIRFLHVNIISDNWKKLSEFYQKAFGGIPTGSVRDYKNEWIANLVGIPGVHVKGQHVAVPGFKDNGPTLEIFTYNKKATQGPLGIDDLGIISTGYKTKNLGAAFKAVKEAGGSIVTIKGKTFARDIDGNLIQLSAR